VRPAGTRARRPSESAAARQDFGTHAERLAAEYLLARGYRILAHNYRTRGGELDLVALHGDTLVFVEVRARHSDAHGAPFETVDRRKQRRVARAAETWLVENGRTRAFARFDVISVLAAPGGAPAIEHLEHAFELGGER
jgi:putative endonuclease